MKRPSNVDRRDPLLFWSLKSMVIAVNELFSLGVDGRVFRPLLGPPDVSMFLTHINVLCAVC